MDLALLALSARPLATSAQRAGLRALVLDLRPTLDTLPDGKGQVRHVRVASPSGAGAGFDGSALFQALERDVPAGLPLILGGGLDGTPELLAQVAARNPLLGNTPTTVRVLKDPLALQALCGHLGLSCPTVSLEAPSAETFGDGVVLEKRIGASGGGHIHRRAAGDLAAPAAGHYLQREVAGETFSVLLLANGRACIALGAARHFALEGAAPFALDGRIGPVDLPEALHAPIMSGAQNIALACGLVGLVSVRIIIDGARWWVLGVTPHPDASLDLFDAGPLPPLLALHLAACGGQMPERLPAPVQVRAVARLRAGRNLTMPQLSSPATLWDVLPAGLPVAAGTVVASVHVSAASVSQAQVSLLAALMPLQARLQQA